MIFWVLVWIPLRYRQSYLGENVLPARLNDCHRLVPGSQPMFMELMNKSHKTSGECKVYFRSKVLTYKQKTASERLWAAYLFKNLMEKYKLTPKKNIPLPQKRIHKHKDTHTQNILGHNSREFSSTLILFLELLEPLLEVPGPKIQSYIDYDIKA